MRITQAAVLALGLLSALPAAAQDKRAQVLTLLRENGCAMTEAEAGTVFPAAKLTIDDVQGVAGELLASGEAFAPPGWADGIRLSDGTCRPAPDVLARDIIGSYRSCRAPREAVAARVAGLGGMAPEEAQGAIDTLIGAGAASTEGADLVLAQCDELPVP